MVWRLLWPLANTSLLFTYVVAIASPTKAIESLSLTKQKWLVKLDISFCKKITAASVAHVGALSALNELVLCCEFLISNTGLTQIARGCPMLRTLHLWKCNELTDVGMEALIAHDKRLEVLYLSECAKVSDKSLVMLSEEDPLLHTLILGGVNQTFTDVGLLALANCKHLQTLDVLTGCSITDSGVIKLAENCRKLRVLILQNCSQLTDFSIIALAQNSSSLVYIDVVGCKNLTEQAVELLFQRCHSLNRLRSSSQWASRLFSYEKIEEWKTKYSNIIIH